MVRPLTFIAAVLLLAGLSPVAQAQAQDWELLGQRHANLAADHDVIPVGIRDGRFRTIQLRVRGNAIHLMDLRVNFANGTTYDVPVRTVLRAGTQTRAIDLPGELRIIRNVRMTYRTVGRVRNGRANVRLFGRRGQARPVVVAQPAQPPRPVVVVQPAQPPRPVVVVQPASPSRPVVVVQPASPSRPVVVVQPAQPAPAGPPNWRFLGERRVNFRGEHDVIPVGIRDGRFRRIQLRVRGNAVHMMSLRVNFANGTTYDVPLRANIPGGGHTRSIDLPGDLRVIRNVRMTYRTRHRRPRRGRATVRLFGSRR